MCKVCVNHVDYLQIQDVSRLPKDETEKNPALEEDWLPVSNISPLLPQSDHDSVPTESSTTSSSEGKDKPQNDSSSTSQSSPTPSDFAFASSESSVDIDAFLGPPSSQYPPAFKSFKLVGDNIDKEVRPRDMHSDHQTRSLHYFHTYAVRDRIDMAGISDQCVTPDIGTVNLSQLLPTLVDENTLTKNFSILISRVLKRYMPFFSKFGKVIERHIQHEFSNEMAQKL